VSLGGLAFRDRLAAAEHAVTVGIVVLDQMIYKSPAITSRDMADLQKARDVLRALRASP